MYLARLASSAKLTKKLSQQTINNDKQQNSNAQTNKNRNNSNKTREKDNNNNVESLDKLIEQASYNGDLNLSGKRLKEYPRNVTQYYDLQDTLNVNLSINLLIEIPKEICSYESLEILVLNSNNIKFIPNDIQLLKCLKYLDLSNNQLTYLPSYVCYLQSIEILLLNNNKLVSLPEEMYKLDRLIQLDVSYNEITHVPVQIGDLKSIRSFSIRRNLLVELPKEISKLKLISFDCSFNRINKIPLCFRDLITLNDLNVDNNPLEVPPISVCSKGLLHIMKYLLNESIKEEKKRGILSEYEITCQYNKNKITYQSTRKLSTLGKIKRKTVTSLDSGYHTITNDNNNHQHAQSSTCMYIDDNIASIDDDDNNDDSNELVLDKQCEDMNKLRLSSNCYYYDKNHTSKQSAPPSTQKQVSLVQSSHEKKLQIKTLQMNKGNMISNDFYSDLNENNIKIIATPLSSTSTSSSSSSSYDSLLNNSNDHHNRFNETNNISMPCINSGVSTTIKKEQSPLSTVNHNSYSQNNWQSLSPKKHINNLPNSIHDDNNKIHESPKIDNKKTMNPAFTIKRHIFQAHEELKQIEMLKKCIESKLKITLPDDLSNRLSDGVLLCHLINQLLPRSIQIIHVPSLTAPQLSLAKCRKNVENFIGSCRQNGLSENDLCCPQDIIECKNTHKIARTVLLLMNQIQIRTNSTNEFQMKQEHQTTV